MQAAAAKVALRTYTIPTGKDKVEGFTGFLKQNRTINKTMKMKMNRQIRSSFSLRSQS